MIFELLYFDTDIAVIKKPAGVLSEGDRKDASTVPGLLFSALCDQNAVPREIYTVHRLDRETQGLMVYALSHRAAAELSRDVAERRLKKAYHATVLGIPESPEGTLCDLLFFDRKRGKSFVVDRERKGVKDAKLNYKLLQFDEDTHRSKLEIELLTGRTHQIRVQFASRGMPLVGDRRYGAPAGEEFDLTSVRLEFDHPVTKKPLCFEI